MMAAWRNTMSSPEASSDFMPKLWEKIEVQQRATHFFPRLASGFVSVAAALCLFISAAMWTPSHIQANGGGTYVEVLADDPAEDTSIDSAPIL